MSARSDRVVDTFAAVSGDALEGLVAESVKIVEGGRANAMATQRGLDLSDDERTVLTDIVDGDGPHGGNGCDADAWHRNAQALHKRGLLDVIDGGHAAYGIEVPDRSTRRGTRTVFGRYELSDAGADLYTADYALTCTASHDGERCPLFRDFGEDCAKCKSEHDADMARNFPGDTRNQPSPEDVRNHVPGVRVYP